MSNLSDYVEHGDGYRVVEAGKSKYKIVCDRGGNQLWSIQTDTGSLPAVLREKQYTRAHFAVQDIKNYLDGHAERKIVYSNKKTVEKE